MKRCPTCHGPVPADTDAFPFCSERCRMVDLGNWLDERYVVSSLDETDEPDEAAEANQAREPAKKRDRDDGRQVH